MRVLFVASEGFPFSVGSELAELIRLLPQEISKDDIDVRVILPKYREIYQDSTKQFKTVTDFTLRMGWREQYCRIMGTDYQGIHYYFVDNEYYFNRDELYGYEDDGERFAFFCRSVLAALPLIDFCPDVLHLHDWQSAMTSLIIHKHYANNSFYANIKTVFTIHNVKHQGIFPKHVLGDYLDLGWDCFHINGIEFNDQVNYLKAGLAYSHIITTVSPGYARDILDPIYGESMDGMLGLRKDDLYGILNGVDYQQYNSNEDSLNAKYFNADSLGNKQHKKMKLQKELGLLVDRNIPVLAMITPLVTEKGLDLVGAIMSELLKEEMQVVILGTGEEHYTKVFQFWSMQKPHKLCVRIGDDKTLARRIYAGSDMLLVPSFVEPFGLSPLIALRYGTIPIVRETGGLRDTIRSYNEETQEGNGFSFVNYTEHDLLSTIRRTLSYYHNKLVWDRIQSNAIGCDYSWSQCAHEYIKLYQKISIDSNHLSVYR